MDESSEHGPLHVVRVDPLNGNQYPVQEELSLGEALELVAENQKPNRDMFLALNADGEIVFGLSETQK